MLLDFASSKIQYAQVLIWLFLICLGINDMLGANKMCDYMLYGYESINF